MRTQTGSSLVAVLAVTTAVLLVGGALFALGVGEGGQGRHAGADAAEGLEKTAARGGLREGGVG